MGVNASSCGSTRQRKGLTKGGSWVILNNGLGKRASSCRRKRREESKTPMFHPSLDRARQGAARAGGRRRCGGPDKETNP